MKKFEELEKDLLLLEEKVVETNELENLRQLENDCFKLQKYLIGTKNYLQKQSDVDLKYIRNLIKKIKEINQIRIKKIKNLLDISFVEKDERCVCSSKKNVNLLILNQVDKIMMSEKSNEEKLKELEILSEKIKKKIELFSKKMEKLKKNKKENYSSKKFKDCQENEEKIKKLLIEVKTSKIALQQCKSCISQLRTKKIEINYPKNKKEKIKVLKDNHFYYLIIYELLNNDKYFLLLKKIVEKNPKFLNARFNGEHILLEILDKYIYNSKMELLNQNIVHINPNYYYLILKLYLDNEVELTIEEKKLFVNRLEEFKTFIINKYKDNFKIVNQINELLSTKKEKINKNMNVNINLYQNYLMQIILSTSKDKKRVNLTKEYLENISKRILKFKETFFELTQNEPSEDIIKENLNISYYDIRNSEYLGNTLTFDNQKYAFNLGYDKDYNIYFRIHVLDTSFIEEDSIWHQEMSKTNGQKRLNKALKFRLDNYYPTITYQLKISPNGHIGSFKTYESVIKIDKKINNSKLMEYRKDEELKNFIGYIKFLASYYDIEIEYIDTNVIEKIIDFILNLELKEYFMKNKIPTLYFTENELSEEDKYIIHNKLCYYLGKIPKNEAHELYRNLNEAFISRFYSIDANENSKIELNSKNIIGYNTIKILKAFLNGYLSNELENTYITIFEEIEKNMNNESLFTDYETQKQTKLKKRKKV